MSERYSIGQKPRYIYKALNMILNRSYLLYFSGFDRVSDMKCDYPLNAEGLLSAQSQAAFFTEVTLYNNNE